MKKYFTLILALSFCKVSTAQKCAISVDKMNIFYIGVDNPITITVENTSNKSIVVKSTNGTVTDENGHYNFEAKQKGKAEISIYKKTDKKLLKIGTGYFRVKTLPLPVFKIGAGGDSMTRTELANQQFVRAQLEGFDFQANFQIDSFVVCILPKDTCRYIAKKNIGNRISAEIQEEFRRLKENDLVIFKDIFIKTLDGAEKELMPVMITIHK